MKKKFDCLIIGLGNIGMMYDFNKKNEILSHVNSIINSKKFSLYAAVDINKKKREIFSKKYKITSYKKIEDIKKKKFDLIILSTPTETHYRILKKILTKFKTKAILCEKPFTNNLQEANKIYNLSKNKCKIFINYSRITDLSTTFLKKKISKTSNIKGEVFYSKSLKNNCSHFINLLDFFFGKSLSLMSISKKKEIFLVKYKKAIIKFSKKNSLRTNNFFLKNEYFKINYRYSNNSIYIYENHKKKTVSSYNNKINFYVIKNLESYLLKKKFRLCTIKTALKTHKIMEEIENLK